MKGRRRARRSALQALYELDQTGHDLEVVLAGRLSDFYRAAAVGVVPSADLPLVISAATDLPGADPSPGEIEELAARLGTAPARLEAVVRAVRPWRPLAGYLEAVVRGVWSERKRIDGVIARLAPEWPIEQMAPVDRNVLRIALWEMATGASPVRVAINEAVELARTFSGEGARRMVNGALGSFAAGRVPLDLGSRGDLGAGLED